MRTQRCFLLALLLALNAQPTFASVLPEPERIEAVLEETDETETEEMREPDEPETQPEANEPETDAAKASSADSLPETTHAASTPDEEEETDLPLEDAALEEELINDLVQSEEEASKETDLTRMWDSLLSLLIVTNLFLALNLGCLCTVIFSRYVRG